MVGHLMVMNPMAKKRRRKLSAKQIAAGFGGKRHRRKTRKKARRKARKAAVKIIEVKSNPTRGRSMAKRKRRHHHKRRSFKANPMRRRFRRNPLRQGFVSSTLGPAAWGAGGAVLSQWLQSILPLPAGFQTGLMAPITQIGYALVVGYGVDAVAGEQRGSEAAAGGMILAFYNLFSQLLGGGLYGNPQAQQMARYLGYLRANPAQLAQVNRQRQLRGLQPINAHPQLGANRIGIRPLNPNFGLGNGRQMRMGRPMRNGGVGYIGPARTLGRYMQR